MDPKQKDPKKNVSTKDPKQSQPSPSESWTTVSRKKKQLSSRTSKGEGKEFLNKVSNCERTIGPAIESFEPHSNLDMFWTKKGPKNPSFFLASSQDELVEACELVKGDSKVKATVLVQSTSEPSVSVPEVSFVSTCLPFLDGVGKVVTRRVWKWSTEDRCPEKLRLVHSYC